MIQAQYYNIVCNKVIIRDCIMDSEMLYNYMYMFLNER